MAKKKNKTIAEMLKENPDAEKIFLEEGMMCAGCPLAQFETMEEGAIAHGLDAKTIKKKLKKKTSKS